MKLSKNFWLSEFTKSQTAIRRGIDNTPTEDHILNLIDLTENVLQPLRDYYGLPVSISSGYRSPTLSKAIGSSVISQHGRGEACDFEIAGVDNYEVAKWIQDNLDFDQLILEFYDDSDLNSGWIHCSFSKNNNRRQVLRAFKQDGKTVYQEVKL